MPMVMRFYIEATTVDPLLDDLASSEVEALGNKIQTHLIGTTVDLAIQFPGVKFESWEWEAEDISKPNR